jgi:ABC-type Fe3+/spermidine/putrescine transport system ATPase subunit
VLSLKGISLRAGGFILRDINLEIKPGEYFMLVGPAGAGKTLLLEAIAGLHHIESGQITLDGEDITGLPLEKRGIGVVLQDGALFPHLSVAENIAFGLKVRRQDKQTVKRSVTEAAEMAGATGLLERRPATLSGGEKQRVALARSLILKPRLLLLDEPLSALDPESSEAVHDELRKLHRKLGTTTIHVTHKFEEAASGDCIAVLGEGGLKQVGTPEDIFRRPNSMFVASFTMMRNILPGLWARNDGNKAVFLTGGLELLTGSYKVGATHACIRPEDISISEVLTTASANSFTGVISRIEDRGTSFHVVVEVPPEVCCLISRRRLIEMGLRHGQKVEVTLHREYVHVF